MTEESLKNCRDEYLKPFLVLAEESKDLCTIPNVERISKPSPLVFYRDYVAQNKPVIIIDAFQHWKCFSKWTNHYLREKLGEKEITVDVTPNGLGDAVVNNYYFVKPEERKMKFSDFLDIIECRKRAEGVFYVQHQNNNLCTEFDCLLDDIDSHIDWVTESLGYRPDVVNFWMGEDRAISSLHKDHYENMYIVVSGEKHFTLLPPMDFPFLYENEFVSAQYKFNTNGFDIEEDCPRQTIRWIPLDPDSPDLERFPYFKYASPVHCTLYPGEMLYLPSMYYHKVKQHGDSEGRTIAVNFCKYSKNELELL